MKELIGASANLHLTENGPGGELLPMVETILLTSEPQYRSDDAGRVIRVRATETLRLRAAPDGLRELAQQLGEFADQADALAERATGADKKPAPAARPPALTADQRAVLGMAAGANNIGTPLGLDCKAVAEFGRDRAECVVSQLVLLKLMYRVRETDDSPAGWCLTTEGDAVAQPLWEADNRERIQNTAPGKYGNISTTGKQLHPGEPVFLLRATDPLAPAAVRAYGLQAELCNCGEEFIADVHLAAQRMSDWQAAHKELVKKLPD